MQKKAEFYESLIGARQEGIVINRILRTEVRKGKIWECVCDCGKVFEATTTQLNKIQSCPDCSKRRVKMKAQKQLTKHGKCNTRLHKIWWAMISRCSYEGDTNYKYYGERGIDVCDEWRADFMNFYNWAMANGYKESLTIDRINNDGDYKPSNCRWVTLKEQFRNRRTTHIITINGQSKTQKEWAEVIGISHTNFSQIRKRGGNVEEYIKSRLRRRSTYG